MLGSHNALDIVKAEVISGSPHSGILFICDHASNAIPEDLGDLGLSCQQLERHIAYDIGAAWVTRELAKQFNAPAILTSFSRLVIDPNRGRDDPTLVMKLSDGAIIPGNRYADEGEVKHRLTRFYDPYDRQIQKAIEEGIMKGVPPAVISIHSFTPVWRGVPRPWKIGILWDRDDRLAKPLLSSFEKQGIVVGNNEPYSGALEGDTLNRHATHRGLAHVLIEIRQDLISCESKAREWAQEIADHIRLALSASIRRT